MKIKCNFCESVFDERYIAERDNEEICPCCKKTNYLMDVEETDNYIQFTQEVLNRISVNDLVNFDDGLDNLDIIVHDIVKAIKTERKCPRCNSPLYLSDLPEYDYVCVDCNENFYECEVR